MSTIDSENNGKSAPVAEQPKSGSKRAKKVSVEEGGL